MSIKIIKNESVEDNVLMTDTYGQIHIVDSINTDEYASFDTFENYELFVNLDGEIVAILLDKLKENNNNLKYEKIINDISVKYDNLKLIKYDETENAIIIQVDKENINILDDIEKEYKNTLQTERITAEVLFLTLADEEIQLEDNSPLDKLSDQDMKNVITKAGVKLSGSENKERLKGIMQGVLSTAK